MLVKVSASAGQDRSNVRELAEIFRGRVVDVAADSVIVEISGTENKIEAFIDMIRPLGIIELVRTGRIAMVRGSSPSCDQSDTEVSRGQLMCLKNLLPSTHKGSCMSQIQYKLNFRFHSGSKGAPRASHNLLRF